MPKLFCLLILWAACAAAQTVEGSVVNAVTGSGIAGVEVRLTQAGRTIYTATTDAQGYFRIQEVKNGAYAPGYFSPDYWQAAEAPRSFQVAAGTTTLVKLEGRMIPLGRISGRVIDGRGEPVPDARLDLNESAGIVRMGARTDAKGKFEVRQFLPGAYTLAVFPPAGLKPPDPEQDGDRAWARTYYPGVTVPEAASRIAVRPGAELSGIEVKLLAVPTHSVRGMIVNPNGMPAAKVSITLEDNSNLPTPLLRVESKPDGAFEFPAVPDGEWLFAAEVESGGVKLRAARWMEITGRALAGVKLQLNAPFTIRGRVVIETPKGLESPQPLQVLVSPFSRARAPMARSELVALSDADGNFNFENVYPGAYWIAARNPMRPYYLDGIRLGDSGLAMGEIELSSGALPITLVYKAPGGAVRGAVEKCAAGWVVLVPQDAALRWPDNFPIARCDSNDHYQITAVRPGEYYAVAVPADPWLPFLATRVAEGLLNQAISVTVRAGEISSADLRTATRPAY